MVLVALLAASTAVAPWWAVLEPDGWAYLGMNDKSVAFTRPVEGKPTYYARIWARFEYRTAEGNVLSRGELFEVDCEARKDRMLQAMSYGGRNLTGEALDTWSGLTQWSYPLPGTFEQAIVGATCDGPKPAP